MLSSVLEKKCISLEQEIVLFDLLHVCLVLLIIISSPTLRHEIAIFLVLSISFFRRKFALFFSIIVDKHL
ncbi:hypothetical protein L1887_10066 [Cichorium endivia]|nr:hypothetical protein L1887_10066 [Cichorium endivia]